MAAAMGIGGKRLRLNVTLAGSSGEPERQKRDHRWQRDIPAGRAPTRRGVQEWDEDAPVPRADTGGSARGSGWASRSPSSSCGRLSAPERVKSAVRLELSHLAEMSRLTPGTARHVLAGQPEKDVFPALRGGGRLRFRTDAQEPPAECDALLPHGVGEKTIVSDPDEPRWEHVQQEAPEERDGGKVMAFRQLPFARSL